MAINLPAGGSIGNALKTHNEVALESGGYYVGNFAIPRSGIKITAYGDAAKPKPVIHGGVGDLIGKSNITLDSIVLNGRDADRGCIRFLNGENLNINNCVIENFGGNGITFQGYDGKRAKGLTVNGTIIRNCWNKGSGHVQGVYCGAADGIKLTGNIFSTNGWKPNVTKATVFNHNVYLQSDCSPALVEGNIFHNASSHGLQQRCGGDCRYNIFIDNPCQHSYGWVAGSPVHEGGVKGTVERNVYIGGRDIAGSKRGWPVNLSQINTVTLNNILIVEDTQFTSAAMETKRCDRVVNTEDVIDPSKWNLTISNVTYDWTKEPNITLGNPKVTNVKKATKTVSLRPIVKDFINRKSEIRKMNDECFAAYGMVATTPVPTPPPTPTVKPPTNLTVRKATSTKRMKLEWTLVAGADKYYCYRNGVRFTDSTDNNAYYDGYVTGEWHVTAVGNGVESPKSNVVKL